MDRWRSGVAVVDEGLGGEIGWFLGNRGLEQPWSWRGAFNRSGLWRLEVNEVCVAGGYQEDMKLRSCSGGLARLSCS